MQEHLPLIAKRSMEAVLGNWSDILHSEQPESSHTAGLSSLSCLPWVLALEQLQLEGRDLSQTSNSLLVFGASKWQTGCQTDGLQPFGVLELLQLRGTERHLPQGRVQGLTDKAWQAFSVSSCTCTEPTTRNPSGDT